MKYKVVRNKVRLYRFYNMNASDYGSPFGLCDMHKESQTCPNSCVLIKLSDKSELPCDRCYREEDD